MSTDRESTRIVRSWLQTDEHESAERLLGTVFDLLDATPQRRQPWRAWRTRFMSGTARFAAVAAVALVVAVVAGALYFNRPAVVPAASPTPGQSPSVTVAAPTQPAVIPQPTPGLTVQPTQTGARAPWVVFTRGDGRYGTPDDLWAMRADGSEAHEIMSSLEFPNIAWSQDGRRLLVEDSDASGISHFSVAEVSDVIGSFVDTGFGTGADTACNEKSRKPFPCQDFGLSFAPDGERVVLLQACTYVSPGCAFITIIDLTTGERTELQETIQRGRNRGQMGPPAWSADGSMIAFVQEIPSGDIDVVSEMKLFIINADGTNLHQVDLAVPRVAAPQWAPDDTTLALMSDIYSTTDEETTLAQDIYTVRADGSGLVQLTTDGHSSSPEWTLSGRIRFRHGPESEPSMTFSIMDADGGNLTEYANVEGLLRSIAPSGTVGEYVVPGYLWQNFYWQPAG